MTLRFNLVALRDGNMTHVVVKANHTRLVDDHTTVICTPASRGCGDSHSCLSADKHPLSERSYLHAHKARTQKKRLLNGRMAPSNHAQRGG